MCPPSPCHNLNRRLDRESGRHGTRSCHGDLGFSRRDTGELPLSCTSPRPQKSLSSEISWLVQFRGPGCTPPGACQRGTRLNGSQPAAATVTGILQHPCAGSARQRRRGSRFPHCLRVRSRSRLQSVSLPLPPRESMRRAVRSVCWSCSASLHHRRARRHLTETGSLSALQYDAGSDRVCITLRLDGYDDEHW